MIKDLIARCDDVWWCGIICLRYSNNLKQFLINSKENKISKFNFLKKTICKHAKDWVARNYN